MKKNIDARIAYFDNLADTWDDTLQIRETIERFEQLNNKLLGFTSGLDVLEIGCGTGNITSWLTRKVFPGRVFAIDFSSKMIEKAKSKNIKANFSCEDICNPNFISDVRYDIAFCLHAFPHFRDKSLALQNISKLLKPTGRLLIVHLKGSKHINQFHADLSEPVNRDFLPAADEWDDLLAHARLIKSDFIDEDELFFLHANLQ